MHMNLLEKSMTNLDDDIAPSQGSTLHFCANQTRNLSASKVQLTNLSKAAFEKDKENSTTENTRYLSNCYQVNENPIAGGAYGTIHEVRALCLWKDLGKKLILKRFSKFWTLKSGVTASFMVEIEALRTVRNHENFVKIVDVIAEHAWVGVVCVFEPYTLLSWMNLYFTKSTSFSTKIIKRVLYDVTCGLNFLHSNFWVHRDIKPENILFSDEGVLKICDLGLATRCYQTTPNDFNDAVTLWYRPPELLLGETHHRPSIDMWSVGCLITEMMYIPRKMSLFPGNDECELLELIFDRLGPPDSTTWPEVTSLRKWKKFELLLTLGNRQAQGLFPNSTTLNEVERMAVNLLSLNPARRPEASALHRDVIFWAESPMSSHQDVAKILQEAFVMK